MNNKELPQDFVYSNYIFSFDSGKVQIPVVYNYLNQESYWAQGIPESPWSGLSKFDMYWRI